MHNCPNFENNNENSLPSVADLALLLYYKIANHKGGVSAVWKKIDDRLKDEGNRSIDGEKYPKNKKISFSAFRKAYQRLAQNEDSDKLEKMKFGIIGNPVLLMNVFEILGIKGFSDLIKTEFKKPDILDEMINIDSCLESINEKIDTLTYKMENMHRRTTRAIKISTDFENILLRLFPIIDQNQDPKFLDPFYYKYHENKKDAELDNLNLQLSKALNDKKLRKIPEIKKKILSKLESNTFQEKAAYTYAIFSGFDEEVKCIALFFLLFYDYKEYIYQNRLLLIYFKRIKIIEIQNENYNKLKECIISPLFVSYLFMQITLLFIRKLEINTLIDNDQAIKHIKHMYDIDSIKLYLLKTTKSFNQYIETILNYFIEYNIEDIQFEKYIEYKKISKEIIAIYYDIFIVKKVVDEQIINTNMKLSIKKLNDIKNVYMSGMYSFSREHIDRFDKELNNISDIVKAFDRDING